MTPWHKHSREQILLELRTDFALGLTEAESARRLAVHGPNELFDSGTKSKWTILYAQFRSLMVIILIGAGAISVLLGDYHDAIAIATIVALNTLLGFSQEYRAEKAMAALKQLSIPNANVRRLGVIRTVSAADLVPGDVLLLEAGNLVPADCRILESASLETQEAALTGESHSVHKKTEPIDADDLPLGDRLNMAYAGTVVVGGRGVAAVVATGMTTELGRVARLIQGVQQEATPLQRRLDHLGKQLAAVALFLVGVIFFLGLARGEPLTLMLLTAVSIGVAAVPEGLPAVVTISLALGAQRMLRRNALIRKLPAVETLGSVTVICSDKTGTLTENQMSVAVLQLPEQQLDLLNTPINASVEQIDRVNSEFRLVLAAGVLCNDALLQPSRDDLHSQTTLGDPTEVALLLAANRFKLEKSVLEQLLPRRAEIPFSAERKRMTTVHSYMNGEAAHLIPSAFHNSPGREKHSLIAITKGSVESVLDNSTHLWVNGRIELLSNEWREQLAKCNDLVAGKGMRVLGFALRPLSVIPEGDDLHSAEQGLIFLGMMGMIDPPREGAAAAVTKCKLAGIRPIMITGDHALTAKAIAEHLGFDSSQKIVLGNEIEGFSANELASQSEVTSVYARVSPEHKLRIIEALSSQGHIVAMTGDGVNDAPALKKAAIGIAMGRAGTDVAKESAAMILLDDNFATIVAAVEEGRVIYDNVRKFIKYILATNSGEIWIMLAAPLTGMPLPLLPIQILWMNLVTDGLPALALGIEPAECDTMRRKPYPPNESIFSRGLGRHVIWVGLLMASISLAVGFVYWSSGDPGWQTIIFTTLTLSQMAHILAVRTERAPLITAGLFSNMPLLGAVLLSTALQIAIVQLPILQSMFRTTSLSWSDWGLCLLLSSIVFCAVEIEKWWLRGKSSRNLLPT